MSMNVKSASALVQLTDYQAKYFAYELTKRCPADSVEKLAGAQ
jgi:adenine-specific DNA-methyltransferase